MECPNCGMKIYLIQGIFWRCFVCEHDYEEVDGILVAVS